MDPELKMTTQRERVRERESLLELAMEISLTSLGSSQTLPFPHLRTLEASRFWSLSDTIATAVAVAAFLSLPLLSLGASGGGFFAYGKSKGILYSTHDKAIFFRVRVLAESLSPERIIWRVTC